MTCKADCNTCNSKCHQALLLKDNGDHKVHLGLILVLQVVHLAQ